MGTSSSPAGELDKMCSFENLGYVYAHSFGNDFSYDIEGKSVIAGDAWQSHMVRMHLFI